VISFPKWCELRLLNDDYRGSSAAYCMYGLVEIRGKSRSSGLRAMVTAARLPEKPRRSAP
jgi:hypothetical protein